MGGIWANPRCGESWMEQRTRPTTVAISPPPNGSTQGAGAIPTRYQWSQNADGPSKAGAVVIPWCKALCPVQYRQRMGRMSSYGKDYLCSQNFPFGLGTWGNGLGGTRTRICGFDRALCSLYTQLPRQLRNAWHLSPLGRSLHPDKPVINPQQQPGRDAHGKPPPTKP